MSCLLPAEQEVWKNVFFTILLFYWAIFVSWFKVIISVVRVLQLPIFPQIVWIEYVVHSPILLTFNISLFVFEVTDF